MNVIHLIAATPRTIGAAWHKFRSHWVVDIVNRFVILLFLLSLVAIAWRWNTLPPVVPLWFSRPWGTERLAPSVWLFLLPVTSLVWYWLSVVVATYMTREYPLFTRVLFLSSLLVSFLSFVAVLKILSLVS